MNALLLIDLQNDFVAGGALAVPDGESIAPLANRLQDRFDLVVATQDWHPIDHGSFAASHPGKKPGDRIELGGLDQILWPVHCVQDTPGAALVPALSRERIDRVFHKGTDPGIDSYSAFFDNAHRKSTGLEAYLKERGVRTVTIMGLATDYCVKFSALDALEVGLETVVVTDGCRGVGLEPGDVTGALKEMQAGGARLASSEEL